MQDEVRYRQQYRRCGKANCRTCVGGDGHGPYWYAFWREDGRLKSRYVGKRGPNEPAAAEGADLAPRSAQPDLTVAESDIPAPVAAGVSIWVLGQFRVERGGRLLEWRRQSAATVLKALIAADRHRLGRDYLATLLHGRGNLDKARAALTSALHALRHTLEPNLGQAERSRYIVGAGSAIELRLDTCDWLDLREFEAALARAAAAPDQLADLEAANRCYGGPLMPDDPAEWCSVPREALRLRWYTAMLAYSEAQIRHGKHEDAAATLARLLAADPSEEEAARRLMTILARFGRRVEALRIYKTLKLTLRHEFRAEPAPETMALANALQAGSPLPRRRSAASTNTAGQKIAVSPPVHPLAGRHHELEHIRQVLLSAREGAGHALVLSGEVGIGKTRLAEETALVAGGLGFTVLWGRAGQGEHDLPYGPFAEALRAYAVNRPSAALRRELAGAEAIVALLPEIGAQLGILAPPAMGTAGAERLRFWTAIHGLLAAACESRPLLLILEDVHWADDPSLSLLAFLSRRCRGMRILVLATVRSDVGDDHAVRGLMLEGSRDGSVDTLQILALRPADVGHLVAMRLGLALPDHLTSALHAQCGGNPFFIGEVLALLREAAGPAGGVASYEQHLATLLEGRMTLPGTIKQTLTRRLDNLSMTCRTMLRAAAVIGPRFSIAALARVITLDAAAVEDALDQAVVAALVYEDAQRPGHYYLAHALLQLALYCELLPGQRRRLHLQAAELLVAGMPDANQPHGRAPNAEVLAYHYMRAGERLSAAIWQERAGDQAAAIFALSHAGRLYLAARENLRLPHDLDGIAGQIDKGSLARIEEKIGDLRMREGDFTAAGDHFQAARHYESSPSRLAELWRKEGVTWEKRGEYERAHDTLRQAESLAQAGVDDEARAVAAEVALCLGEVFYRQGKLGEAEHYARSLFNTAPNGPAAHLEPRAHNLLGSIALFRSDYAMARSCYARALDAHERAGNRQGMGAALNNLSIVALYQGDLAEAQSRQHQSLTIKQELGDQGGIATSWYNLGEVLCDRGELARAATFCRHARQLARRLGYAELHALAAIGGARVYVRRGLYRQAGILARHGAALAIEHRANRAEVYAMVVLSELHLALEWWDEAHGTAEIALRISREIELPRHEAIALRLLGRAAAGQGELARAETTLREALRRLQSLHAAVEAARTQVCLAELLARRDSSGGGEAAALEEAAVAAFIQAGARWDLAQARSGK